MTSLTASPWLFKEKKVSNFAIVFIKITYNTIIYEHASFSHVSLGTESSLIINSGWQRERRQLNGLAFRVEERSQGNSGCPEH